MTGASRRLLRAMTAGMLVAALSACGESSTGQSLGSLVLSAPPAGYTAQPVAGADGVMSIDDASRATPADPASVRAFLQSTAWRGTIARVWVHGQDYAEDIGFAFATAAEAQRFAQLEVGALQSSATNYVYPFAQVPRGEAFILFSQTRVGGRNVFCNGVWFAFSENAFEVLTCGAVPQDGQLAASLAISQLQRAGGSPAPATAS
jgi:hypothetical protein